MIDPSTLDRRSFVAASASAVAGFMFPAIALGAEPRTLSFAYDQPRETAYGIFADTFGAKLGELSKGALKVQGYPAAQLGSEPEAVQKVRSGDIDFTVNAAANAATIAPQIAVFSLEYLYADEKLLERSVLDPAINDTVRKLFRSTSTGAIALGMIMQTGLRNMYAKFPIASVSDIKGKKVRVQATKTEDAFMNAYGAQPTHMPFGQVYTALQTGVVEVAENGIGTYLSNKHYEVAPVLSLTQHEANNNVILMSEKTWNSFDSGQRRWVEQAFAFAQHDEVPKSLQIDRDGLDKLKKLGVTVVSNVDKKSLSNTAKPIIDKEAASLGPFAEQILKQIRALG
ncbi:MAG: TRAP transporter substrate-binding protein [Candidatus Velthaea sp.]